MYFLFNITTLQVFVTYLTAAVYVHPLWFYKHQHDNQVRSKLFVASQRWWFQLPFWFVSSVPGFLREEEEHKPDPWRNPIERNWLWTIVTERHSWNVSAQNAFSLPFTAILVNCAPIGEMHYYCTPHIIKENFENFLIFRCKYILLSQVYCVWQVVKTPTIIVITLYTNREGQQFARIEQSNLLGCCFHTHTAVFLTTWARLKHFPPVTGHSASPLHLPQFHCH